MGNMGYCRFRNTLGDLRDCVDALADGGPSSKEELDAMQEMIEVAQEFLAAAESFEPEEDYEDDTD